MLCVLSGRTSKDVHLVDSILPAAVLGPLRQTVVRAGGRLLQMMPCSNPTLSAARFRTRRTSPRGTRRAGPSGTSNLPVAPRVCSKKCKKSATSTVNISTGEAPGTIFLFLHPFCPFQTCVFALLHGVLEHVDALPQWQAAIESVAQLDLNDVRQGAPQPAQARLGTVAGWATCCMASSSLTW